MIKIKALWPREGEAVLDFGGREWRRGSPARIGQECIAAGLDLWFEGLGFPQRADACEGPKPVPDLTLRPGGEHEEAGKAGDIEPL